jgi:ribosomal protein S2
MNNSVMLKAISEYAQKYGVTVVALGDPNQNTAKINYEIWYKDEKTGAETYTGKNGSSYVGYE